VGRIAALDVGDRRIGLAVSDPLRLLARPVGVIRRRDLRSDLDSVRARLQKEEAVGVVVGLPLLPSGDRGEQAAKVDAFVLSLRVALTIPVDLWDESFTTLEAERRRHERGGRSDRRPDLAIDAHAAAVILEEWLLAHEAPPLSAPTPRENEP